MIRKPFHYIKENLSKIATVAAVVLYCMHTSSCANTTGAPTGGPKDTIPPVITGVVPDSNAVNVTVNKTEITLSFNEYVQVKDAEKNIVLSPPQKKRPKTKIKGKSVVVTFDKDLDSNKTYSIYFGSAIVDNNEGNPLSNYVYSFSTGNTLDSMIYSGTVMDYATLLPQKGITVALYSQPKDSSVLNTLPDAITKTDNWGYFCFRNLKPVPYALFAFKDDNNNNLYDPGLESIGFSDSLITPSVVYNTELPQVARYDMFDTLNCLNRPSQSDIYIFKEKSSVQYIRSYKRVSQRGAYIKFNAPDVIIDSFSLQGVKSDRVIKEFNQTNDSLSFWINMPVQLPDTLHLGIKYHKTDSLGKNVPTVENLLLVAPIKKKEDKRNKDRDEEVEREDLLKFNLSANPKTIEQEGYVFEFTEPLVSARYDTLSFTTSTPKGVKTQEKFTFVQDSMSVRKYIMKPVVPFKAGNDYELKIPQAAFRDINGFTNDSLNNKIMLPTDDKLSSITLEMTNVNARYIVELVNETRNKVFRKYTITGNKVLEFPYLDKGNYSIRITEDKNSNELLDPGSLLERRQPEMVRLYKLADGNDVIVLEERMDLEQRIDVQMLFSGKQPEKSVERLDLNTIKERDIK